MQQTETYKLNLIESSDPFLPDALNANTQKIEAAMTAHEAAVQAAVRTEAAALDQRITVLEAKKFAYGRCAGNVKVTLGFEPVAVLMVVNDSSGQVCLGFKDGGYGVSLKPDGFQGGMGASSYSYLAFG